MATPTDKGFLLTDNEAAAVRRWVQRQPSPGPNIHAGTEGVARRIGLKRVHLQYCLTPTTEKRRVISEGKLAALVRLLSDDARARYELRRVACDEVQGIMDEVHAEGVGRVITRGAEGVVVLLPL